MLIKFRIAVVGPEPLVADICEIASEFNEVVILPLIYQKAEESAELVKQHQEQEDIFLFSGPTPYMSGKNSVPAHSKAAYIPFEGTDIYRLLLQVYEHYHYYPKISFDIVDGQELNEIYHEMKITRIPYYLQTLEEGMDSERLTNYHSNLLKEGKAEVVATTLNSVYEQLQEAGSSVFLIKHTKAKIRDTLQKILLREDKQRKEERQIIVLKFQILYEKEKKDVYYKQLNQIIIDKILKLGRTLFSSTNQIKDGMITLYTTKGVFEKATSKRQDFSFLHEFNKMTSFQVNLGIGIGKTVQDAVYNASNALEFSIRKEKGSCFLIDEQKRIYGPLGTTKSIDYTLASSEVDNQHSLTLRKFYSWLLMMQKSEVTTREISLGMSTSERHAARILKSLHQQNVAKIIGKESMNQKGRPRLVYKIDLNGLANHLHETKTSSL
ncbi:hypothetical protein [Niallia sp. NCCP-28]|uniref:hypothetical protein n=1 Tax=Niallia sp. NCCP-28 TaxID=2934712 RepID=UPI0020803A08|nr:hypothetical protein [Niallia sp. NCCP-28]GKU80784.1 hypothetical protein NCCP28_01800 [Niallia sp. NCCP-28]